ncbi:hypothetical protein [Amycolatopsis kentuckyensis]|uniref:hypothetical protein n=1 Tax=Amycolatopsis kentuckyensis TaxID=218823 RepID=UPI001177CEDC|nr:hypothetical protein [Amycolatopsis kentuckyensis]
MAAPERRSSNTARALADYQGMKKFARDVAVSILSALILAGLTRASRAWPNLVAKFDGNNWLAGAALALVAAVAIWLWWLTWELAKAFRKPTTLKGWAAIIDNVGAGLICLMFAATAAATTVGACLLVFG